MKFLILPIILVTLAIVPWLRFCLPITLRCKNPALDKFLCKVGSHRCIRLCSSGCCWECVRCESEKRGELNEHYAKLNEFIKAGKI